MSTTTDDNVPTADPPSTAAQTTREMLPLPATKSGFLALRTSTRNRTIIDYAEDLHIEIWEDDSYRILLDAVMDSQAKEGSLKANHYAAAAILREKAQRDGGHSPIATANLETIKRSINWVLRRYNSSPKQRRQGFVNGSPVANGEDC